MVEELRDFREFEALGLSPRLLNVLAKLGYARPTEIQRLAIPKILRFDRHVLIAAPTGSGKTEAALLPLIDLAFIRSAPQPLKLIYVTPLRALNRDLEARLSRICNELGLRIEVWHGDTPQSSRKRIRSKPPHILITTPESFQVILVSPAFTKIFRNVYAVIIDEAHELATSERGAELAVGLERLEVLASKRIRRIALSGPSSNLDLIARYFFGSRSYIIVESLKRKRYEIVVTTLGSSENVHSLGEAFFALPELGRLLYEHVARGEQVLVFVNTRTAAEALSYMLNKLFSNTFTSSKQFVYVHHGSLSREVREYVEHGLRNSLVHVVVATSSLELGIDIGRVEYVIQVMSPRQAARLVQRVGRASHREGAVSRGAIVVPPILIELLESLVIARRAMEGHLEEPKVHTTPLDVLAHQIIGIALNYGCVDIDTIYNIVSRAAPFENIEKSKIEEILNLLSEAGMLRKRESCFEPTTKGRIYYLTTVMIVDTKKYSVRSIVDGKEVATLDEEFVAMCKPGQAIVLNGRLWRILDIDPTKLEVYVEPMKEVDIATMPRWIGENIPVDYRVAREVCALIRRACSEDLDEVLKRYPASQKARDVLRDILRTVCQHRVYPSDQELIVEVIEGANSTTIVLYACLGTRAANALAMLVSNVAKECLGVHPIVVPHQIAVAIHLPSVVDRSRAKLFITKIFTMNEGEIRQRILSELRESPVYAWSIVSVAKKLGLVSRDVGLKEIARYAKALRECNIVAEEALREVLTEKLELEPLINLVENVKQKRKKLKIFYVRTPSRFAREILSLHVVDTKSEAFDENIVLELIRRRLVDKTITILCTSCGYVWRYDMRHLKGIPLETPIHEIDSPSCPRCGSRALATITEKDASIAKKLLELVRSSHRVELLDNEEKKLLKSLSEIANLYLTYGIATFIALQGIGVGPETTKRILSQASTLRDLVKLVYEAERKYLVTRRYWDRS